MQTIPLRRSPRRVVSARVAARSSITAAGLPAAGAASLAGVAGVAGAEVQSSSAVLGLPGATTADSDEVSRVAKVIEYDDAGVQSTDKQFTPPANWRSVYDRLHAFRYGFDSPLGQAPVDTMGCDRLSRAETLAPHVGRFHILCALLLSSQTRDQVTAEAMRRLHHLMDASEAPSDAAFNEFMSSLRDDTLASQLTVDTVLSVSVGTINRCIAAVGFHNKKALYLQQVARILADRYQGDIPKTVDELQALPGIGPKMAYLTMQSAWGKNCGIGVDTHVHRISARLGWVPRGTERRGPEATRKVHRWRGEWYDCADDKRAQALEEWLPRELWSDINHMLVGLGQLVCTPLRPNCARCAINDVCPSAASASSRKRNVNKLEQY